MKVTAPALSESTRSTRRRAAVVSALAATSFAVLTILVAAQAPALVRADFAVHNRLRELSVAHPGWLSTTSVLTHIGDGVTLFIIDVLAIGVCLWWRRPRAALLIAVTCVSAWLIDHVVSPIVGRPRPADRLWHVDGSAFPSGHATNSAAITLSVLVISWPLLRGLRRAAMAVAVLVLTCTVGVTRLVGGVHWSTDVMGAWLLSLMCVAAAAAVWPPQPPRSWSGSAPLGAQPLQDPGKGTG